MTWKMCTLCSGFSCFRQLGIQRISEDFNACVSAVVCFGGGHRTLYKAGRVKIHKGVDEAGLVAELLKKSPDDFQADLLFAFVQSFSLLLWSGVLALTRPSFPTGNSGKSWGDPFVSQSATGACVCHAHVSLTRGFEMKK